MDRLVCVDVVQLPLQVLLRSRPDWVKHPSAVVAEDKPQGRLLFANEAARQQGVLPGQRYAAALSLCAGLRAAVVGDAEIATALTEIARQLAEFTPGVETSKERPGVFWLDAKGLTLLEPSLPDWARRIDQALRAIGFVAHLALGFRRFATLAAAETRRGLVVFDDAKSEQEYLFGILLARIDIEPKLRDELGKLGIHTVGEFARLPQEGVRSRFGEDAERLHRLANDRVADPFSPAPIHAPLERRIAFEEALTDSTSLLFFIKPLLHELLDELAQRGLALEEFTLRLKLENGAPHAATLRPAAPTLQIGMLMQLATLHFEQGFAATKDAGARRPSRNSNSIEELFVGAQGVPARPEQLSLFRENPRRDLHAGERALALVRSRFGETSIGRIVLQEAHLPEARFRFEPITKLEYPQPSPALERVAIRRIFSQPIPVSPPRRHPHDDGWILHDLKQGTVTKTDGPYVVSGGWWAREVHREYRFVHTLSGDVMWVFYDKKRRRWFLQGDLE